jgi:hypothetical protein
MSFKSWIDLFEKFTPRCPQCNRKFRNRLTCQVCRTDTCSQNCHSKHFKAAHPELVEQLKAEKREEDRRRRRAEAEEAALASPSRGLRVDCPGCRAELRVPRKFMGKGVDCPHCGFAIRVPEVEVVRAPPPPPPPEPTIDELEEVERVEEAAPETPPTTWVDAAVGCGAILVACLLCGGCVSCLSQPDSKTPQGQKPQQGVGAPPATVPK